MSTVECFRLSLLWIVALKTNETGCLIFIFHFIQINGLNLKSKKAFLSNSKIFKISYTLSLTHSFSSKRILTQKRLLSSFYDPQTSESHSFKERNQIDQSISEFLFFRFTALLNRENTQIQTLWYSLLQLQFRDLWRFHFRNWKRRVWRIEENIQSREIQTEGQNQRKWRLYFSCGCRARTNWDISLFQRSVLWFQHFSKRCKKKLEVLVIRNSTSLCCTRGENWDGLILADFLPYAC